MPKEGNFEKLHSDLLEAVIGALYLDRGLEAATNFVQRVTILNNIKLYDIAT